jgi:hypothetical protein
MWKDARETVDACNPEPAAAGLEGLVGRGGYAHSVRRESCNSDSSPEPAAAGLERGNPVRGWGNV